MKPITRKEFYLAKAAGTYTGPTPPPVLREDYYLATLAGDYSGYCPAPVTRIEKYMSAAAGLTTYVPQPVTRIEKYWYAIAKGTGYVPEPVTREEKFLYAVLKNPPKPEYLDKTAEGNPILLLDSAEAPLTALTLYGWSKQDGTPSPENPVPIVSAGSVMTTGAQLFDIKKATPYGSAYGLTISIDGEEIKISGTVSSVPDDGGALAFRILNYPENLYGNTFSADIVDDTGVQDCDIYGEQSENAIKIVIGKIPIGTEVNLVFRLMVNSGSTALPWEPYTGGIPGVNPYAGEINVSVSDGGTQSQTLTLSTPGGLPGIPVDSGGNYTDADGQQWICDEIDLARGKLIKRVGKTVVDGADIKFEADSSGSYWNLPWYSSPGIKYDASIQSTYFPFTVFNKNKPYEFIWTSQNLMSSYFSTVNELNQFCTEMNDMGQPVTLYYTLDTPIETDLTAEEIAAYQVLHTYSPTTTVTNDADAWMKVGYKANT